MGGYGVQSRRLCPTTQSLRLWTPFLSPENLQVEKFNLCPRAVSVFQDLGATTKFSSPPPLSQRARGDKIRPLPLGEGWGEGAKS